MLVFRCSLAGAITHLKVDCEAALVSIQSFIPVSSVPLRAALCITLGRHFAWLKGKKAEPQKALVVLGNGNCHF